MVSSTHEVLHRFFQEHPQAIDRTLQASGIRRFPNIVRYSPLSTDVTEFKPLERRADTVMRVTSADGDEYILVFEAQGNPDSDKRESWPYYIEYLASRYHRPVVLIVVCWDKLTARWARKPIYRETPFWTTSVVYPLVLAPENVPMVNKINDEDLLTLGLFSVVMHAKAVREPDLARVAAAIKQADPATRDDLEAYVGIGLGTLPTAHIWRTMMSMDLETFRSSTIYGEMLDEHDEKLIAESKAEGKAQFILRILDKRSVPVTEQERERIRSCTDLAQLDAWFDAALDAVSGADVFR